MQRMAYRFDPLGVCRFAERPRQLRRVAKPAESPEVIPVGVNRLRQIALVAGRLRQDAEARALLGLAEFRPEALRAQRLQV